MNPILILVIGVIWLGSLVGVGRWQHTAGVTAQKAADQTLFDKSNQDLADQKTKAASVLAQKNVENMALLIERDALKTKLEKEHAQAQAATAAARDHYAGLGLRFQPAKDAGRGCGGGGAASAAPDAARADAPAAIELPAALAASLRRIAFDADTLADSYRECWGYAQQVK